MKAQIYLGDKDQMALVYYRGNNAILYHSEPFSSISYLDLVEILKKGLKNRELLADRPKDFDKRYTFLHVVEFKENK